MNHLNRVRKGDPITADAWNEVVDKVNGQIDVSLKRGKRHIKGGVPIVLMRVLSDWEAQTGGGYKATGAPAATGSLTATVDLWNLYAETTPKRDSTHTLCYAFLNGSRWEVVEYTYGINFSVNNGWLYITPQ